MLRSYVCPICDSLIELDLKRYAQLLSCPRCAEDLDRDELRSQPPELVERARRSQVMMAPSRPAARKHNDATLVTDVVLGPNLRFKDNLYQGLAILAFVLLGILIGVLVAEERMAGVLIGGFVGLVAGFLLSGFVLMVYRMFRH